MRKKKHNSPRDKCEIWLDKHNHKLELVRTIGSILAGVAGTIAILKVLGVF